MSRTGGGRGTNQYQIRGRSVETTNSSYQRHLEAPSDQTLDEPVSALRAEALIVPSNDFFDLSWAKQSQPERVVGRYVARRADFAFSAAFLEGNSFTLPEVVTLLEGVVPQGKNDDEVQQILNLTEASEELFSWINSGTFRLDFDHSDRLNAILARNDSIDLGVRRQHSFVNPGGRGAIVSVMGVEFFGMNQDELRRAEPIFTERVAAIFHPVQRAATYAALQSYAQYYLDGNKRTARYMMDGELMSNGYDAVAIPAKRKLEYNNALKETFTSGDTTRYVGFLLDVARKSSS